MRDKQVINKITPYLEDRVARPNLGKWVGAVALSENWLVSKSYLHFALLTVKNLNICNNFSYVVVVQNFHCGIYIPLM